MDHKTVKRPGVDTTGLEVCLKLGFEVCFKGNHVEIRRDGEVVGRGASPEAAKRQYYDLAKLRQTGTC